MKNIFILFAMLFSLSSFAAAFSPEEILGTYVSSDRRAQVKVYKVIVRERTLFDPEVYEYYADIAFYGGPCMEMYGGDGNISIVKRRFSYNGSWLPKTEYLSAGFSGDSDYDGSTYILDASFTASKNHRAGKSTIQLELDFAVGHNPDYSDGEDGGVAEFERCSRKTVSNWNRFIKRK